jgi:hypothetical protein
VASDHPEGTLRERFVGIAERLRHDYPDIFCRAVLYVVKEARAQKVPVRDVRAAGTPEEAAEVYQHAERLVNFLELADRERPAIVPDLEARLREILNPPRPLDEV